MKFLECDLEQIIMGTPNHKLREKGLGIQGLKRNQIRIGKYGIADIIAYERRKEFNNVNGKKKVSTYEHRKKHI
jgi:hypothetical protein